MPRCDWALGVKLCRAQLACVTSPARGVWNIAAWIGCTRDMRFRPFRTILATWLFNLLFFSLPDIKANPRSSSRTRWYLYQPGNKVRHTCTADGEQQRGIIIVPSPPCACPLALWLVARNASAGLIVSCTVKDTVCAGARGLAAAANGGLARATAHETTPPHFCVSHRLCLASLCLFQGSFFPSSILLLIANWSLCFCFPAGYDVDVG